MKIETLHQKFVRQSQEQIDFLNNKPDCVDFQQGCIDAFKFFDSQIKSKDLFLKVLPDISLDSKKSLLRNVQSKIDQTIEDSKIKVFYFNMQNRQYISLNKNNLLSVYLELIEKATTIKDISSKFSDKNMTLEEFNQLKEKENVTTIN